MGREREVKSRRVPSAEEESRNTGSDRRARGGVVEQAPKKRKSAFKGKVQSITDASSQCTAASGEAGPSEKVAIPATECEVELQRSSAMNSSAKEGSREHR